MLLYDEKESIGTLTLNRPNKRNALGREAEAEIIACLEDAGKRGEAKVIIFKAAGDIFCSGHDRQEILNQPLANIRALFQTSFNMMMALRTAPQCIIAQVQGIAMAGGCHLAFGQFAFCRRYSWCETPSRDRGHICCGRLNRFVLACSKPGASISLV